jgi:hypothetical protein
VQSVGLRGAQLVSMVYCNSQDTTLTKKDATQ